MDKEVTKKIAPTELGRRLSIVRRSKNLSQEEVAQRLEVSRPTLVAIEKGVRAIKPEELKALAQLYGKTVHSLVSQREFVADFAPLFRITQGLDVSPDVIDNAVKSFQQMCEDYLSLESLMQAPMPLYTYPEPYPQEGLSPHIAAEEAATNERSRLNLGFGPISDLLEVLENDAGLRVFVLPLSEFKIAGMFAYTDRLEGCILVNGSHPLTRQNWSLAHEYAHFLSDRFKEDITILFEYDRKPRKEQFADAFAASFLMPAIGLRPRFHRIVQSRKDFVVADLCRLADQYSVSVEAMTRRLESLGSLPNGTWEKIHAEGYDKTKMNSFLGIQRQEAHRQRFPERYVRLAVQAFEEERITESELARLLKCKRVEAREIVGKLVRPLEVGATGITYELDLNMGNSIELALSERRA